MMPQSMPDMTDPEMPPLNDELLVAIGLEVSRRHGWDMLPTTIATVYQATRKVLEELPQ